MLLATYHFHISGDLSHCSFSLCVFPLGSSVVCGAPGTQGSEATLSGDLVVVTGGPASGEGLQSLLSDDGELEVDEDLLGGDNENFGLHGTTNTDIFFLLDMSFPSADF